MSRISKRDAARLQDILKLRDSSQAATDLTFCPVALYPRGQGAPGEGPCASGSSFGSIARSAYPIRQILDKPEEK